MSQKPVLAIIGGTGNEGSGLALRFAKAGFRVLIGSRDVTKARAISSELNALVTGASIEGNDVETAVKTADIILLTVPFSAQRKVIEPLKCDLSGKILIDTTVPLVPPKVASVQLPASGSAVADLQLHLGKSVSVVSAFQNVSAHQLKNLSCDVDCDVIVCGDDTKACDTTIGLAQAIGLRAFHGGPICNSAAAEALTSVLIAINKRYKVPGSGIRITGV